jgi:hypothetical protein
MSTCGCGKNKTCECFAVTTEQIDVALRQAEAYHFCVQEAQYNHAHYGYPTKLNEKPQLTLFTEVLERQKSIKYRTGSFGLKSGRIRTLWENVMTLTQGACCRQNTLCNGIDTSGKNEFEKLNPACVTLPRWKKWKQELMEDIAYSLTVLAVPDPVYDVRLTREDIICKLEVQLRAAQQACKLEPQLTKTTKECRQEVNLIKQDHCVTQEVTLNREITACDLNVKLYKDALACNLTPELIRNIYDNDAAICTIDGQITIYAGGEYLPVTEIPE